MALHLSTTERTAPQSKMLVTHRTQRATMKLDDGSTIMLAPETRLHYMVDAHGARSVTLSGEAFFVVVSHSRPFVVHTGAVSTRVLGTAFDVRRYPDDSLTQVSVVRGRVATGGRTPPLILAAGSIGRITDSTATATTVNDPTPATAWTQGNLVFNNTPVPVVLSALHRWYGYEFRLADSVLAERSLTVEFHANRVSETMNMLKATLGATMTFDGNVITLRLKSDSRKSPQRTSIRADFSVPEPEVGK